MPKLHPGNEPVTSDDRTDNRGFPFPTEATLSALTGEPVPEGYHRT
jgi:hypothetical protein